jgi:hypothetical protein
MDAAATIARLAALATLAAAKQTRRERAAEMWTAKSREWSEGALRLLCPAATARWYLRSGHCKWLAKRSTAMHRAAVCKAMGFEQQARDNVAAARMASREALKAARLAERAVA